MNMNVGELIVNKHQSLHQLPNRKQKRVFKYVA